MKQSDFAVLGVTERVTYIIDLDLGGMSVTNDCERVYEWCKYHYPSKQVVYRDSMGRWDEMYRDPETLYIEFKPWYGEVWDILSTKEVS